MIQVRLVLKFIPSILLTVITVMSAPALSTQKQLVILTTFSAEPIAELINELKHDNPDVDIKLIHRRTQSAIQLLNKSYIQNVDLVLSSSPFLMEELHKREQLAEVAYNQTMPKWLMPFLLPKRSKVVSVGYSGAGLILNNDYLEENQLKRPSQFKDLTAFSYFGHITMSTPSRSGTTQLMIESILRQHGWEQGWAIILNIGANLGTVSSRSFSVSDYVAKGQFGIGPTIDSYALVLSRQFPHIGFNYDSDFTLMPTYIGALKSASNNPATEKFIRWILSDDVQTSMAKKDFAKHSIHDLSLYSGSNPALNLKVVMNREKLVNIIFDEAITKRLPELQDVWLSLSEYLKSQPPHSDHIRVANQLKQSLFTLPISEEQVTELGYQLATKAQQENDSTGARQAMLAEFSYQLGSQFESHLNHIAQQLKTLQHESGL